MTIATDTMRALAKTHAGPGAELVERPVPIPGAGEVLLQVEAASICGTDLHLFTWDDWAAENLSHRESWAMSWPAPSSPPAAASAASREGDLVGVESHLFDWTCAQCKRGDMHLCRNLRVIGVHVDGGFAEQRRHPRGERHRVERARSCGCRAAGADGQRGPRRVRRADRGPQRSRHRLRADWPVRRRHRQGGRCIAGHRHRHRAIPAGAGAHAWVPTSRSMQPTPATEERIGQATGGDGVEVVLEMSGAAPALDQALASRDPRRIDPAARHLRRAAAG